MTDRATERLTVVLQETPGPTCTCPEELMRTVCSSCTAKRFTAQGVGFREDHVRAFAFWLETAGKLEPRYDADVADEYLTIEDKT